MFTFYKYIPRQKLFVDRRTCENTKMKMYSTKIQLILILNLLMVIGCRNKLPIYFGDGYKLILSASYHDRAIVKKYNICVIHGHILKYNFDSTFIIALQNPRFLIVPKQEHIPYKDFDHTTRRHYWIINKKMESIFNSEIEKYSNVFGPYSKEEFLIKRKELGVPDILVLD